MPERPGLFNNVNDAFTKSKPRIFSVTEITQDIKLLLENTFTQVWVEGEVSGVSRISTGTVFFTLKDPNAQLKCVIFFNVARDIKFQLKDGMKLVCFGRVSVYDKQGSYQLYVDKLEPKGVGGIQLALEQLKERLAKEGLFEAAHKKPLPQLPSRIGIVTSASGAAIKDILKVLDKRFQDVHIIINSVRVQGEGAKEDIAQAIDVFNELSNVDVIIVTRGGGSIEDLWAFNEEIVARAIYKSRIPVISAVGHERDVTVSDLVADLRAPTPSAAAEIILPTRQELKEKIEIFIEDLADGLSGIITDYQQELDDLAHRVELSSPVNFIAGYLEKAANFTRRLDVKLEHFIALKESELKGAIAKLHTLSPLNILSRGYSITFKLPAEEVVKDPSTLTAGDKIKTRLDKGEVISEVVN